MAALNHFVQTGDELRLETLGRMPLDVLRVSGRLISVAGVGMVAFGVVGPAADGFLYVMAGLCLLFFGLVLHRFQDLLRNACNVYRFNLRDRVLRIEYSAKAYDFLPDAVPFSDIRSLRLLRLPPEPNGRKNAPGWQLEVVLQDGRYYPLTAFDHERKARDIIRALQVALGVSLEEEHAPPRTFMERKTDFLRQFKPDWTPPKSPAG